MVEHVADGSVASFDGTNAHGPWKGWVLLVTAVLEDSGRSKWTPQDRKGCRRPALDFGRTQPWSCRGPDLGKGAQVRSRRIDWRPFRGDPSSRRTTDDERHDRPTAERLPADQARQRQLLPCRRAAGGLGGGFGGLRGYLTCVLDRFLFGGVGRGTVVDAAEVADSKTANGHLGARGGGRRTSAAMLTDH